MKFDYDVETDSLYIRLSEGPYLESVEVAYDIMFDFDCEGTLLGIEILSVEQNATPSKLYSALQNLPEELSLDERHQVQLAFDQVIAGKHKLLDSVV